MPSIYLLAALLAWTGQEGGPNAFVDALYAHYATADAPPREDSDVFTPEITMLFARLEALAGPDEVVREGDDICLCQDWEGLRLIERDVRPAGPDRAEADVRFVNFGEENRLHLSLERTTQGWRVRDIRNRYPDDPGLLASLRADIADAQHR